MLDGLLAERAIELKKKKKEKRGEGKKGTRFASIRYLEEQSVHDDANLVANSSTIPPPPSPLSLSPHESLAALQDTLVNGTELDQRVVWARSEGVEAERK